MRSGTPVITRSATRRPIADRKSTRLNSSHSQISYAVFCLKKKKKHIDVTTQIDINNPRATTNRAAKRKQTYHAVHAFIPWQVSHAHILLYITHTVIQNDSH